MPVLNSIADLVPEITEWRRDFHTHPELQFDVQRTAGIVAAKLREWGCDEVTEGIGRTGVVAVIRGRASGAGPGSGKVIGLRADMDALPILEATGKPYASVTPGAMHACGHDGHTAMLLGAARHLAETRNFDGTALIIFQPAEEGGGGGREMVADGMMERWGVQEVYGLHNWPGQPAGSFAIRTGPFFAATDEFNITVTGRGGHAAKPQDVIDPIVVASHLVLALQTIASRNADPVGQLVVSVTLLQAGGGAHNVIPQTARLRGTVRTLDPALRDLAERRMTEIAAGVAATFGAAIEVDYIRSYPVMVNAAAETEHAAAVARAVGGACAEAPLVMGGEDFAYMLEARPGAYILVGNGDTAPVHHPDYDFNDEIIPTGCSWLAGMVEHRLKAG